MPKKRTDFKTLRRDTRRALKREDVDAEFKRDARAIENDTLVSFANSDDGGWILAGVTDGGQIVGCLHGDREITMLQSRASNCIPPITIELSVENTARTAILVVRVRSSRHRPHCTGRGTYTIRVHNQSAPLDPQRMLALLVERESAAFLARFQAASRTLEEHLGDLETLIGGVQHTLHFLPDDIEQLLNIVKEDIDALSRGETRKVAAMMGRLDELLEEVSSEVSQLHRAAPEQRLADIDARVLALVTHAGIKDPSVPVRVLRLRHSISIAKMMFAALDLDPRQARERIKEMALATEPQAAAAEVDAIIEEVLTEPTTSVR